MAVKGLALYELQRITGDAVVYAAPCRIMAVQLEGGSDASSMDFHNDVDSAGGTAVYGVTAPFTGANASAQSTVFIDLTNLGGVKFSIGCYVDWTGTGVVGYVWVAKGV